MPELFNDQEKQFIMNALDTHVRAKGLTVAQTAVLIAIKLEGKFDMPEPEKKTKS